MAKCPMCKTVELRLTRYVDSLPVSECSSCGGAWLRANEYTHWLATQPQVPFDLEQPFKAISHFHNHESGRAAVCPDCGHFLRQYQVSSSLDFHLDRCHNCNGVWLDKDEWHALEEVGLQDELNRIFTQPWQKHIQDELAAKKLDAMYMERFGGDYAKVKEIREWLLAHPNRSLILAFWMDKDPYAM